MGHNHKCKVLTLQYHNHSPHQSVHIKQGKPSIYIATQLHDSYLEFYHNNPLSGHLGFYKLLDKIREGYYWPQLSKSKT